MLAHTLLVGSALLTVAQSDSVSPKRLRAARVVAGTLRLDGRLSEPAWQTSDPASGFVQREPVEGSPASGRTEVIVLHDDEALYVGARMHSRDRRPVRALVTRRDREGSSEQLVVSLDTYRDRQTAYTFAVTPAGVRIDYYHSADFEDARDYSFDPVWEAATKIDSLGWTAELRIPFSQLRFNAGNEQIWGINLARKIPAANEVAYWILIPRTATGWASRFGELVGIAGVRTSRRLEVVPYVASDATLKPIDDPRDPFAANRTAAVRAGSDVKMGLGPGLTLDATVNPDFGQVEADPAEVNLSAFETFFDERRPFFVEGAQLFKPSGPGWFYSRRIGGSPRVEPEGDYVEELGKTTILGAAKVSGRLPSGLSVAVLAALTDREYARFVDTAHVETGGGSSVPVPARSGRVVVAPRTGYGVVRLQQQFGVNASTAGLILTAVRRYLSSGDFAANVLPREAYGAGVDWRLRWKRGEYDWSGYAGLSHVAGEATALSEIQQSSRHYFQRPDAKRVRFDSLRTTLSGFTAGTSVSKLGGNWRWDADVATESPGLELNDAGRLSTADDIETFNGLRYLHTRPGRRLHNWSVGAFSSNAWNYDGIRTSSYLELNAGATLKNFWEINGEGWLQPRALDDLLTRGGPLMETGRRWGGNASLENSSGDKTQWEVDVGFDRDELGARGHQIEARLTVRPGTQWEVSLEPSYFSGVTSRQYVTTLERAPGAGETYGQRYVFALIDRSELAMRARVNYAVTPDLTAESYAEPFVSSGRYSRFGELAGSRSRLLRSYGTSRTGITRNADGSHTVTDTLASGAVDAFTLENGDFNVLSFRSNVVLRWEWRPGSGALLGVAAGPPRRRGRRAPGVPATPVACGPNTRSQPLRREVDVLAACTVSNCNGSDCPCGRCRHAASWRRCRELTARPSVQNDMNAPRTLVGVGLTFATLSVLAACATSGQRASAEAGETPQPATAASQAGAAAPQRGNSSILTAAEIATVPGMTNAHEAVQALRPNFLRTRGPASRPAGMVGAGAEGQATGRRRPGQVQGSQTGGAQAGGQGDSPTAGRWAQDPGILVYLDRQRYGGLQTLREIPIATVEEIRFLHVGEANSLFGMGHPHGVIQIISKRGSSPQ